MNHGSLVSSLGNCINQNRYPAQDVEYDHIPANSYALGVSLLPAG